MLPRIALVPLLLRRLVLPYGRAGRRGVRVAVSGAPARRYAEERRPLIADLLAHIAPRGRHPPVALARLAARRGGVARAEGGGTAHVGAVVGQRDKGWCRHRARRTALFVGVPTKSAGRTRGTSCSHRRPSREATRYRRRVDEAVQYTWTCRYTRTTVQYICRAARVQRVELKSTHWPINPWTSSNNSQSR